MSVGKSNGFIFSFIFEKFGDLNTDISILDFGQDCAWFLTREDPHHKQVFICM